MPGTPSLQTGRAGFVIYPEKGWLGVWMDAWVSDPSANTANAANTRVNGSYTYATCEDRLLLLCNGKPQLRHATAAKNYINK